MLHTALNTASLSGQNLVKNPSFEQFIMCPNDWDQIDRAIGWQAYKDSPDYYNTCASVDACSVPKNYIGYQYPASGNAYAGLILYVKSGLGNYEMMGAQLVQALQIGVKY